MNLMRLVCVTMAVVSMAAHAEGDDLTSISAEIYLQKADKALREGRLTQAELMINWLDQNSASVSNEDLALVKAEFAIIRNDIAGASAALDNIQDKSRNLCRQDTARGWIAANLNALDPAILAFANAARNCPSDAGIWNLLGLVLIKKGETAAGKEAFEQALMVMPDNPELLNNHALALVQQGELQLAKQQLDKAVKVSPGNHLIAANQDFVSGMIGQTPIRNQQNTDAIWSERLVSIAKGAKAAERGPQATALFSRAVLLLDHFDNDVWFQIDPQTAIQH